MHNVTIGDKRIEAEDGQLLSELFVRYGIAAEHPCGGVGICKKCLVTVDGKEELSCRYRIYADVSGMYNMMPRMIARYTYTD